LETVEVYMDCLNIMCSSLGEMPDWGEGGK